MTRRGSREASERRSGIRGGLEGAGDGATGRTVDAFQFDDIGSA